MLELRGQTHLACEETKRKLGRVFAIGIEMTGTVVSIPYGMLGFFDALRVKSL